MNIRNFHQKVSVEFSGVQVPLEIQYLLILNIDIMRGKKREVFEDEESE
jgi:hypothetical protein